LPPPLEPPLPPPLEPPLPLPEPPPEPEPPPLPPELEPPPPPELEPPPVLPPPPPLLPPPPCVSSSINLCCAIGYFSLRVRCSFINENADLPRKILASSCVQSGWLEFEASDVSLDSIGEPGQWLINYREPLTTAFPPTYKAERLR
jgi:hypothetical protein